MKILALDNKRIWLTLSNMPQMISCNGISRRVIQITVYHGKWGGLLCLFSWCSFAMGFMYCPWLQLEPKAEKEWNQKTRSQQKNDRHLNTGSNCLLTLTHATEKIALHHSAINKPTEFVPWCCRSHLLSYLLLLGCSLCIFLKGHTKCYHLCKSLMLLKSSRAAQNLFWASHVIILSMCEILMLLKGTASTALDREKGKFSLYLQSWCNKGNESESFPPLKPGTTTLLLI